MRWEQKEKIRPKNGEIRKFEKFAFFPTFVQDPVTRKFYTIWWETYWLEEIYFDDLINDWCYYNSWLKEGEDEENNSR